MRAVGIVAKSRLDRAASHVAEIAGWLNARAIRTFFDPDTAALARSAGSSAPFEIAERDDLPRHVDLIVVLGGDFKPNQRLMAYNLADGAERWWIAGLPPCGKSTPVIGGGMLFIGTVNEKTPETAG